MLPRDVVERDGRHLVPLAAFGVPPKLGLPVSPSSGDPYLGRGLVGDNSQAKIHAICSVLELKHPVGALAVNGIVRIGFDNR